MAGEIKKSRLSTAIQDGKEKNAQCHDNAPAGKRVGKAEKVHGQAGHDRTCEHAKGVGGS